MIYVKDWIDQEWFTDIYQQHKRENFEILDQYLDTPPLAILDIGCGLAWESRLFNQKYGSTLWLIDGDSESQTLTSHSSQARYHSQADTFMYYYPLDHLKGELDKLNTKNYRLYNANNFDVPEHVKFDLITSWVSCGFHYPVSTYRELILKHSDQHTKVVMDLRNTVPLESGVTVVNAVNQRKKYTTCEIKIS
jgi:SAM-dependent methyltransferase